MGLRQRLLLWSGATVLTISLGSANAQTTTPPRVLLKNHTMSYGTYLGGGGDDQARGLELLGNGELLAAGNFNTLATKGQISLLRAGVLATAPGKVLRIAGDGRRVLADLTLGNRIDDIAVVPNRDLAIVGGDFGVAMIKPVHDAGTLDENLTGSCWEWSIGRWANKSGDQCPGSGGGAAGENPAALR